MTVPVHVPLSICCATILPVRLAKVVRHALGRKKHHKGDKEASPKDRSMIITMDKLTISDFDYTAGYGGFKYGIVFCSLRTDYWVFIPLRTMECSDAHAGFRQFCIMHQLRKDEVVVY